VPRPDAGAASSHRERRLVLVAGVALGTGVLGATLAVRAGSATFSALGVVLACIWIVGAMLAGPPPRRGDLAPGASVVGAVVVGAAVFGVFVAAKAVSDHIPLLGHSAADVLGRAHNGSIGVVLVVALLNAVGEELFFRGALASALGPRRGDILAVLVYGAVTVATLNLALVVAAVALGSVLAAERRLSGGVLAPVVTHLAWSTLVILFLPR
jgi:uncharacterized protein